MHNNSKWYKIPFQEIQYTLGAHIGAVQSVKFSWNILERNRYYASFNKFEGDIIANNLSVFCQKVFMPEKAKIFIQSLLNNFYIWSIGAAEGNQIITYKLYLLNPKPFDNISIISVEWKPGIPDQFFIKDYTNEPWEKFYDIEYNIRNMFANHQNYLGKTLLEQLIDESLGILKKADFLIGAQTVQERTSYRKSIDFNVGRTRTYTIDDLRLHIDTIAEILKIDEEQYFAWLAEFGNRGMCHFAIGIDNYNRPFITIYDENMAHQPHAYASHEKA